MVMYTWSYDNFRNCYHWWIGSDRWNVAAVQYGNATAKSTVKSRVELLLVLLKRVNMEMLITVLTQVRQLPSSQFLVVHLLKSRHLLLFQRIKLQLNM